MGDAEGTLTIYPPPVIILFGGRSSEHDASLKSFEYVREQIRLDGGLVLERCCYVDLGGTLHPVPTEWTALDSTSLGSLPSISLGAFADWVHATGAWILNLLIGQEGEDGAISGFAQVYGLPGSFEPVVASALGMAKWAAGPVAIASTAGAVRIPESLVVRNLDQVPEALAMFAPDRAVVVKPGDLGASILLRALPFGDHASVTRAAAEILEISETVIIQEYLHGEEYSCGVVVGPGGVAAALPVLRVDAGGPYTHERKHGAGRSVSYELVDPDSVLDIRVLSESLFHSFGCRGMARFDYIRSGGSLYFLEFNTVPGMMPNSLLPRMLRAAGRGIPDLIRHLIASGAWAERRPWTYRYTIS